MLSFLMTTALVADAGEGEMPGASGVDLAFGGDAARMGCFEDEDEDEDGASCKDDDSGAAGLSLEDEGARGRGTRFRCPANDEAVGPEDGSMDAVDADDMMVKWGGSLKNPTTVQRMALDIVA